MTSNAERLSAALSDRYRIERELGAGGMATVFLAEDLKHDRKVAIKVLKPELAAVLGAERFVQEIKTTAALSHPHILPLFDSGEAAGFLYYVMPYIEGETIRDRLNRETQLGVEEAVRITVEVADALDYAHRHGVIHRDIKPENILLHDGRAMVMDFGIALAVSAAAGGRMTETGLSLGTPHYMSPEQATADKDITARSDVYSLASVLYEMLTGNPPHTGSSAQQIIMKIIAEPVAEVTTLRKSVPANVAAALGKALEKLPADRFPTAAEFARALGDPVFRAAVHGGPGVGRAGGREVARRALPWLVAAGSLGVAVVALLRTGPSRAGPVEPLFASLDVSGLRVRGGGSNSFSVSPDGGQVVFAVDRNDNTGLAVRALDAIEVRLLPGTRGAAFPFWSPDGKSLGFFADDSLKTVELASGTVRSRCRAGATQGGTWGIDGTILFSGSEGMLRTSGAGGPCEVMPVPDEARAGPEAEGRRPTFFPDGRHYLVTGGSKAWLGELGRDRLVLLRDLYIAKAVLAPPDYLMWPGADGLLAQRVDLGRGRMVGDPVRILPRIAYPGAYTGVSVSANGVLVASPATGPAADSAIVSPGRVMGTIERGTTTSLQTTALAETVWDWLRLSHDGTRVALGGWDLQAMSLASGRWVHLAETPATGREIVSTPLWSPRDTAVVYETRPTARSLRIASLASGAVRTVSRFPFDQWPGCCYGPFDDLSPDGRWVVFARGSSPSLLTEAWEYDLVADTARRLFLAPGSISDLRYDPAGGWIAYQVTTPGQTDVFLRPYPSPGSPIRISSGGARMPRWRANGSELFYLDGHDAVTAVPVQAAGSSVTAGAPTVVTPGDALGGWTVASFDVAPDGRRFRFVLVPEVRSFWLVVGWRHLLGGTP